MRIRPTGDISSLTGLSNFVRRVARDMSLENTKKVAKQAMKAARRQAYSTLSEKKGHRVTSSRPDQRKIRKAYEDRF